MNRFEITQEISAPAGKVWEVLSEVRRWPEWNPSAQKVVALTPQFVRLGSRFLVKQPRLAPLVYEVTVFEPDEFFSVEGPISGFSYCRGSLDHALFLRKKGHGKPHSSAEGLANPLEPFIFFESHPKVPGYGGGRSSEKVGVGFALSNDDGLRVRTCG